jgi:hypothetical protein
MTEIGIAKLKDTSEMAELIGQIGHKRRASTRSSLRTVHNPDKPVVGV